MKNRFNLVDEPWIPVAGKGLVSLADIFSDASLSALGGNPVQKIALTKLLLAIAQVAYTPEDDEEWEKLGAAGMAEKSLAYLRKKRDLFWLYGERPFLQMPVVKSAGKQSFGALQYFVATGNTTVLTQDQIGTNLADAEKALLLIQVMSFCLGGKKTDNSIVLSPGYQGKKNTKGKPSTGKPGASIGYLGFLHSFLQGSSLQETIWFNCFSEANIKNLKIFSKGLGEAPWEKMPQGENCPVAIALKNSYLGRLIPFSRFVFLNDNGVHYTEGILHPGHLEGIVDTSVAIDLSARKPKVIWADPEKRPWRQLPALLSFLGNEKKDLFDCVQLRLGIPRVKRKCGVFGIWSGGLRVSNNAGEQYVSGSNDFVESQFSLKTKLLGDFWFANFKYEMNELDNISKIVYGTTISFYKMQKSDGKDSAGQAASLFWQLCERKFQNLVDACADLTGESAKKIHPMFANFAHKAYDSYCPKDTARQLDAWAANRPNLAKYLVKKEGGL